MKKERWKISRGFLVNGPANCGKEVIWSWPTFLLMKLANFSGIRIACQSRACTISLPTYGHPLSPQKCSFNTNFPNQYRTKEEHLEPFRQADGDFSGLRVVSYENDQVNCPFQGKLQMENTRAYCPSERCGPIYINSTRTWSNSTFVAGAVNGGATLEEANALTDEMFRQYSDRVAEDPSQSRWTMSTVI